MVTEFISCYAKMIVANPDDIEVSSVVIDEHFHEVTITANNNDIGKLIGKNGNMINAIKTIINGCKAKNSISYKLQVIAK